MKKKTILGIGAGLVAGAAAIYLINRKLNPTPKILIKQRLERGGLLIDVRSPEAYENYHLEHAINIPLEEIERVEEIIYDKEKPLTVYCKSGRRATEAYNILKSLGYKDVYNLGSIENYK